MTTKSAVKAEEAKSGKAETKAADFLMWVGSVYYPTVDVYIEEAKRLGVCKRMGKLPKALVPGKSRVFLLHDDGLNGDGFIFGYFVPDQIQYLIPDEADIPETLQDRVVWVSEWDSEEERECGTRHEGMYALSMTGEEQENEETAGKFVVFAKPRSLAAFDPDRKHFRGLLQIDWGGKVISCKDKSCYVVPPSRTAHKAVDPNAPFTEEEDEAILEAMEVGPSMSRVAQELAYKSGRPKSSILYRFQKLTGRLNGKEDEEGEAG